MLFPGSYPCTCHLQSYYDTSLSSLSQVQELLYVFGLQTNKTDGEFQWMREDFQCCFSGEVVCGRRHPSQTNKNSGSFQGVSVSIFFLYRHGEIEKEGCERLFVGCYGGITTLAEL